MRNLAQTFLFLLAVNLTAKEPLRTWTSADGRTIEARFIDEKKDKVRIRRTDGRVFNIPLDNLSEEDQKYVKSLAVDKLSLNTDPKDEIEETDTNTSGDVVSKYGSKPNYFVKSALDLEMIWVEPGTFTMGLERKYYLPRDKRTGHLRYLKKNVPIRTVILTKGFYLGKYEVTQEEYEKVMGKNPSQFKGGKLPVEMVNWDDAVAFCEALTKMELQNNYGRDDYSDNKITMGSWEFTLPTEAQWEYACRAGTTTRYSFGQDINREQSHFGGSTYLKTRTVGYYYPNPWGFFDMHGNVREWTFDRWEIYGSVAVTDPEGPAYGMWRTGRGGSWRYHKDSCTSYNRWARLPNDRRYDLGFRVALRQVEQTSEGSLGSSMGEYPSGSK
jgi:formylglycine-generating enzyme required for sulfatase activity